jgi:uncharacterized protein
MKHTSLSLLIGSYVVWFSLVSHGGVPTSEETHKILNAAPDQARVQTSKPRQLLVFSRAWGYKHSSIPYGEAMLKALAQKTKAFDVTMAKDTHFFEQDRLMGFDAVFFNNTNNEIFLPENFSDLTPKKQKKAIKLDRRLKANLVKFISSGKGLAVIHAGVASFREWPEYGAIIGARFDNHPWNAGSTITLNIEDHNHALCQAFLSPHFEITDEIYQFKEFDRDLLRVLFSIDTSKTDITNKTGIHRPDKDFALSWIKQYGKGRVFYSALGHQHDIFWNKTIVKHFLDGIQFTLGDLIVSTTSIPAPNSR